MKPSHTAWLIVFSAKYFRLTLTPGLFEPKLKTIELAKGGNVRSLEQTDIVERVVFPYSILFCIYKDKDNTKIMGAHLPTVVENQLKGC